LAQIGLGTLKRKSLIFRKEFFVGGFLLFSVLVLGQFGWACDEPNDYLCVEELDIKGARGGSLKRLGLFGEINHL
jgi:hypothetical protein